MNEQLDLLLGSEAPCRRDHAGCGVHHAVWEARFATCWFVRQIGMFESGGFRVKWEREHANVPPCVGWLSAAATKRIAAVGRGER